MKRKVVWTQEALGDFTEIVKFVARNNAGAARRISAALASAGERLADFATGRPGRVSGTYEKSVAGLPYIIAYEVLADAEGTELIGILRVIHTARKWPKGAWPK